MARATRKRGRRPPSRPPKDRWQPARRRGGGFLPIAIVLAVAGAGGLASTFLGGGDTPPASTAPVATTEPPSRAVEGPPPAVVPTAADYEVTYRVETFSAGSTLVGTEVRRRRFPFEASISLRDGEPGEKDRPLQLLDVFVLGGYEVGKPAAKRVVFVAPPGPPARSGHFGGDVVASLAAGVLADRRTERTVLDRTCRVFRTKGPLDVPRLEAPTDADFADLCLADDGLVLREEWTVGGKLFRRRTAVAVDAAPNLGEDDFTLSGARLPPSEGGGRVRRVTDDSRPPEATYFELPAPPDGFVHAGRYGIAADTPTTGNTGVDIDGTASVADLYTSETGVVLVENIGTVSGGPPFGDEGELVEVPGRPGARAILLTYGTAINVPVGAGRFVRVSGTLPLEDLVAFTRTLVERPGGAVVAADDREDVTGR